jgi:serine/threonine protein kinase
MNYLFKRDIYDWNSWGAVFQSIEAFRPLIEAIFIKEGLLGYDHLSNLTPGTNGVFKAGGYVIKIFAPKESGANTDADYHTELNSMKRAIEKGINTPRVIAASYIEDKYLFRYLIMDYIEGQEAGSIIKNYSFHQKIDFVNKLKENLHKINTHPAEEIDTELIKNRAIDNKRWEKFSDTVKAQRENLLRAYELSSPVYVHGDITADNVMIDSEDNIFIIDFADSTIAPVEYEYPSIVFDLFDSDKEMVYELTKDMYYDDFIEKLFMGILLHQYGDVFVNIIYNKCTDKDISKLTDIYEIKELIARAFL